MVVTGKSAGMERTGGGGGEDGVVFLKKLALMGAEALRCPKDGLGLAEGDKSVVEGGVVVGGEVISSDIFFQNSVIF